MLLLLFFRYWIGIFRVILVMFFLLISLLLVWFWVILSGKFLLLLALGVLLFLIGMMFIRLNIEFRFMVKVLVCWFMNIWLGVG